jgi:hypothetical protein
MLGWLQFAVLMPTKFVLAWRERNRPHRVAWHLTSGILIGALGLMIGATNMTFAAAALLIWKGRTL